MTLTYNHFEKQVWSAQTQWTSYIDTKIKMEAIIDLVENEGWMSKQIESCDFLVISYLMMQYSPLTR